MTDWSRRSFLKMMVGAAVLPFVPMPVNAVPVYQELMAEPVSSPIMNLLPPDEFAATKAYVDAVIQVGYASWRSSVTTEAELYKIPDPADLECALLAPTGQVYQYNAQTRRWTVLEEPSGHITT